MSIFYYPYFISACGGNITTPKLIKVPSEEIKLFSPNWIYRDYNCEWNVTAPKDQIVVVRYIVLHCLYI